MTSSLLDSAAWHRFAAAHPDVTDALTPVVHEVSTAVPPVPVLPATGFIRLPAVLVFYPVSKAEWWQRVADGRAPAAVKLAPASRRGGARTSVA